MSVVRNVRAGVLLALLGACGCASPRFVNIGPEGGTIAMPSNSAYYRREAYRMLDEKYPGGYVIDHEGEVVVGQVLTNHTSDHDVVFGHQIERQTEVHNQTEWHIDFHLKGMNMVRQSTLVSPTLVPPNPPAQPTIQQASYTEQPVRDIRTLPKEPVPILGSDGQAPR
jgi:hypothetical protein